MQPTSLPTSQPTSQPSRRPSSQPTTIPTLHPGTTMPTNPSSQPTKIPSGHPSRQPSMQPTSSPSRQPSTAPSHHDHYWKVYVNRYDNTIIPTENDLRDLDNYCGKSTWVSAPSSPNCTFHMALIYYVYRLPWNVLEKTSCHILLNQSLNLDSRFRMEIFTPLDLSNNPINVYINFNGNSYNVYEYFTLQFSPLLMDRISLTLSNGVFLRNSNTFTKTAKVAIGGFHKLSLFNMTFKETNLKAFDLHIFSISESYFLGTPQFRTGLGGVISRNIGMLFVSTNAASIDNVIFIENEAQFGSAIAMYQSKNVRITNSTFFRNYAEILGTLYWVYDFESRANAPFLHPKNNIFVNNTADLSQQIITSSVSAITSSKDETLVSKYESGNFAINVTLRAIDFYGIPIPYDLTVAAKTLHLAMEILQCYLARRLRRLTMELLALIDSVSIVFREEVQKFYSQQIFQFLIPMTGLSLCWSLCLIMSALDIAVAVKYLILRLLQQLHAQNASIAILYQIIITTLSLNVMFAQVQRCRVAGIKYSFLAGFIALLANLTPYFNASLQRHV